jgi:lysosomal Pro-X carboxypeptidase
MPMGDDPAVSCFTWDNWDKAAFIEHCNSTYQQTPKFDWALDYFGGRNPSKDFASASNIVFSNGDLDPWSAGGVTQNITSDTIALYIKDSAHHLDLREPNELDGTGPGSVTEARLVEAMYVKKWVQDYQNMAITKSTDL